MHSIRRAFASTGIVVAVLGAAGFRELPFTTACDFCQDSQGGGGGWGHSFQSPGAQFETPGHFAWLPGQCGDMHDVCNPEEQAQLEENLKAQDGIALRALLRAHPDIFSVNAARAAIQVADCDGHLMAHFPISAELAQELGMS